MEHKKAHHHQSKRNANNRCRCMESMDGRTNGRTEWSGGQLALLGSSYSGSLYATGIAMSYTRSDRGTPQTIDGVFAVYA